MSPGDQEVAVRVNDQPTATNDTGPMRSVLMAGAIFVVIVVLIVFVSTAAFSSARSRLADEFAVYQYSVSLYTARHVADRYQVAAMSLERAAADADGEVAWPARPAAPARDFLGEALVGRVMLDASGQLISALPPELRVPPEAVSTAWQRLLTDPPRGLAFFQDRDGSSRLLLLQGVRGPAGTNGALGFVLSMEKLLTPPEGAGAEDGMVMFVVDQRTLEVLASTGTVPHGTPFDRLFGTATGSLFEAMRDAGAGWEREANLLPGPAAAGVTRDAATAAEPFLVGVSGFRLGDRTLSAVAVTPGRVVDAYLSNVLRWILLLGSLGLLGLVSFVTMWGQSTVEARQERRRSEERRSLYEISHALNSISRLDDILQIIADQARELIPAEGATIAMHDESAGELVFSCVSSSNTEVRRRLLGLRIPADHGVIGWVLHHAEPVLVNNVNQDPRFAGKVDEQSGVQTMSLMAAPLMGENGECIGVLELVNTLERPFPDADLVMLRSIAATATSAIGRAVLLEREAQQERIRREVELARTVQQSLLPRAFPAVPGYSFYGASDPAREIGGDFFDFTTLDDRRVGVVIADVADKGVGAAMFMVMCRTLFHLCAQSDASPAAVLTEVNRQIDAVSETDLFVTAFYGVLDVETGQFTFSSAGHNPPLLWRAADGSHELLRLRGIALGALPDAAFQESSVQLLPGDRLVLYTDGITDALSADEESFGTERLIEVVGSVSAPDAHSLSRHVLAAVDAFMGKAAQFDDITLATVALHTDADQVNRDQSNTTPT